MPIENQKETPHSAPLAQSPGCFLCPRRCGADREEKPGYCAMPWQPVVARAALHFGEEPCLSGTRGSGTMFFSGCNLRCVFCQNHLISQEGRGKPISVRRLVEIFFELQAQGAHNLNLVTGVHFVPAIAQALQQAKKSGLSVPVVYNSSGYETVEALGQLEGLVDIYLPDFKYASRALSARYSAAPDYVSVAKAALSEMVRQRGMPAFDKKGMLQSGVIVRHLMLPGALFDSKKVIDYLWQTYGDRIYISLMRQFTPVGDLSRFPELQRTLPDSHYEKMVDYMAELGITQAYVQEAGAAGSEMIPVFDFTGV